MSNIPKWDDTAPVEDTPKWEDTVEPKGMLESGARGAAQGASLGFADELTGAAEALWDKAIKGDPTALADLYKKHRDESRGEYDAAEKANPKTYLAGELTGGLAVPVPGIASIEGATLGAKVLKGALAGGALGGAAGFGASKSDDIGDQALDTAKGAAMGGVFGAAVPAGRAAVEELASKVGSPVAAFKGAAEVAGRVAEAGKEGAKDAGALGVVTGPLAAAKEVLSIARDKVGEAKLASTFRDHIGPGASKNMSDAEVIAQMVHEGNDTAINYVANRANQLTGAPVEEFSSLLKAGAPARANARNFDFDKAGEGLASDFDALGGDLHKAAGSRVDELNTAARGRYSKETANPQSAVDAIDSLVAQGREHPGTVGNLSYIEAAGDILKNGSNTLKGLTKEPWDVIDDKQMYDRLQAARKYLGENIEFSKRGGLSNAAQKSTEAYHSIGDILKFDPDKMESDAVWSGYKNLQKNLLDQLDVNGKTDKYKVGGMLKDTTTAKRFRDNLELLDDFSSRPGLSPEIVDKVKAFREKFASQLDTAELRRTLQKFEANTVGSSRSGRAAQAAESLKRGDNVLGEMIKAPEQSLRTGEGSIARAEKAFRKPFSEMDDDERRHIVRFEMATKKNPDLDFVQTYHKWHDLGKKRK